MQEQRPRTDHLNATAVSDQTLSKKHNLDFDLTNLQTGVRHLDNLFP